jgi:enamine deaminase RidA (YjgF/YER057c/UK114 family)
MATQAVSGIMGAYGQVQAGKAAEAEAKYQAGVSTNNAIVASAQARDAQQRGDQGETEYARQYAQLTGNQRAAFAANGIVAGEGSALRMVQDTAMLGHIDEETIRRNTEREKLGYLNQRNQFLSDAQMQLAQGKAARRAANFGAVTGLLGTAASIGLTGASMKKPASTGGSIRINPKAYNYFHPRPYGLALPVMR